MKKNLQKIKYDRESKVLTVEMKKTKSVDSDIRGNIVIDYDKNRNAVRVNLYDIDFANTGKDLETLQEFTRSQRTPFSMLA